MLANPIGRLRAIGWTEGLSFLVLLCVAMPLKYLADMPLAVRVVGWIHGLLFIAYCWVLFEVANDRGWPWTKNAKLFVAALVPFGPFIMDKSLKEERGKPPS
jgi:integral membrane protein